MKPIGVFTTARNEGPGYFASYLERRSISWGLVALDEGRAVPRDPRLFSGLCFMGGAMSVNDPLPWIAPVLELMREAVRRDVPLLGHCLGAQLMSRAFGGTVRANACKEIGWGEVRVCDNGVSREWFGELPAFETFQWHGETFSIPPGATRVLENPHCMNQAFALGKHFGMQCHVEMSSEMVRSWVASGVEEMQAAASSPAVQSGVEIGRGLDRRIEALHQVADRVYDKWIEGLARSASRGS